MPGSLTQAAVLLSSAPPRRRVLSLPASELGMLMRFALLRALHREAAPSTPAHQLTSLATVAYAASRRIEGLEQLWPFLNQLASDWIQQRRLS